MKTITKILIALDGSKSSKNATERGLKLAQELGAQTEIIYVIPYAIGNIDGGVLPYELEKLEKERAIKLINRIKTKHPDVFIKDIEPIGEPAEEIQKAIDNWKPDIFIIGHHTHTFLENLFVESIEKKLLHNLKIPLLIIPENYKK